MGRDERVLGVQDPIQRAMMEAQAREMAQQQMQLVLQGALQNPHSVRTINMSMCALRRDGDAVTLMIALLDGSRLDVVLSSQTAAGLAKGLDLREEDAAGTEAAKVAEDGAPE